MMVNNMKNNDNNSYRHTLKYASLFGGVQGLNVLIGVARNKFAALILGPAGMGLAALCNSAVTLISTMSSMGMSMSGVKGVSEAYGDDGSDAVKLALRVKLVRSLCLVLALVGAALCIVLSPVLSRMIFNGGGHVWEVVALAPVVGMTTVMTGELAVMKGARMLGDIARLSVINVVAAVIVSVPLFWFYGMDGIIPSMLLLAFSQMSVTLWYSGKRFPWRVSLHGSFLRRGKDIVRLGVAFVMAGVMGTGADFLVRQFLNGRGALDAVGLFNAGYMLTVVYGGLVFSAMETDYFPRLSAIKDGCRTELADVVNKQIEVSLTLVSPMLVVFVFFLPVIVPLLFSGKFASAVPMAQVTVLAMFLRALRLPMSYIPLAKSDSRSYLFLEGGYSVVAGVLICLMYSSHGLVGTGYALVMAAVYDFFALTVYTYYKYGFKLSKGVLGLTSVMLPLGIAAYVSSQLLAGMAYWGAGTGLIAATAAVSLSVLHRKTHLVSALKRKLLG